MTNKRKFTEVNTTVQQAVDPSDELRFTCLGGGGEVGRSCHILEFKGKTIMLDCGMHPGKDGMNSLPFLDGFDLSKVDVLLVTHFHIDHAAAVPYLLSKTNFQGSVFMTYPTRAIYKSLIKDAILVNKATSSAEQINTLYTLDEHEESFLKIKPLNFYSTLVLSSMNITPYPAGHVLGAAMYLIDIAGIKILFTGDYSREEDRHLIGASIPKNIKIDVLICESTFGTSMHSTRSERETQLMRTIFNILDRGGRVLMPVFAVGTAQELLLILEDYWSKNPSYQKYPIYYASRLAKYCLVVYQTYISTMNDSMKALQAKKIAEAELAGKPTHGISPWDFKFIRMLPKNFEDTGPCVMLASPGMMQNGASRKFLEKWAPREQNGVVITGYSVEGTMAHDIALEPLEIASIMNKKFDSMLPNSYEDIKIPRKCSVDEITFAAHVDGVQNRKFIEEVNPEYIILVHGSSKAMLRLSRKLLSLNTARQKDGRRPFTVYSPPNGHTVKIPFVTEKFARVVGSLAERPAPLGAYEDRFLTGVLVQNDFNLTLMAPIDIKEHAGLTTTTITIRKRLFCSAGVDLIRWGLEGMFGQIQEISPIPNGHQPDYKAETTIFDILNNVKVIVQSMGQVCLEWEGNTMNDSLADSILSVLLKVERSMAGVKQSGSRHSHNHTDDNDDDHNNDYDDALNYTHNPHRIISKAERLERIMMFLEDQFGAENITPVAPEMNGTGAHAGADGDREMTPLLSKEVEPTVEIALDENIKATLSLHTLNVECPDKRFKGRVKAVINMACDTVANLGAESSK